MIEKFGRFCKIKLQLADRTVEGHIQHIKCFLNSVDMDPNAISKRIISTIFAETGRKVWIHITP